MACVIQATVLIGNLFILEKNTSSSQSYQSCLYFLSLSHHEETCLKCNMEQWPPLHLMIVVMCLLWTIHAQNFTLFGKSLNSPSVSGSCKSFVCLIKAMSQVLLLRLSVCECLKTVQLYTWSNNILLSRPLPEN